MAAGEGDGGGVPPPPPPPMSFSYKGREVPAAAPVDADAGAMPAGPPRVDLPSGPPLIDLPSGPPGLDMPSGPPGVDGGADSGMPSGPPGVDVGAGAFAPSGPPAVDVGGMAAVGVPPGALGGDAGVPSGPPGVDSGGGMPETPPGADAGALPASVSAPRSAKAAAAPAPADSWPGAEETTLVDEATDEWGSKWVNRFRLRRQLGRGQFGRVVLAERVPEGPAGAEEPGAEPDLYCRDPVAFASYAGVYGMGAAADAAAGADGSEALPLPPPAEPLPRTRFRQFAIKVLNKRRLKSQKIYTGAGGGGSLSRGYVTALEKVQDEIAVQKHLWHRHVALMFEVIDDPFADDADQKNMYLVLELMPGGESMDCDESTFTFTYRRTGKPMPSHLVPQHIMEVAKGLTFLHGRGIIHRDIKPENILMDAKCRCVINDFGSALMFGRGAGEASTGAGTGAGSEGDDTGAAEARVTDQQGTPPFQAPEIWGGAPYSGYAADVWALGVTGYVFAYGVLPFSVAKGPKALMDAIIEAEPEWPSTDAAGAPMSADLLDLLRRMLIKDPAERITLPDVLAHPAVAPLMAAVEAQDEADRRDREATAEAARVAATAAAAAAGGAHVDGKGAAGAS